MLDVRRWITGGAVLLFIGMGTAGAVAAGSERSIHGRVSTGHRACPPTNKDSPSNQSPAAKTVLVPGAPRGLLLCRYRGPNPDPTRAGTIARSRRVERRLTVKRLARKFNALKSFPPCANPAGCTILCPATDGTKVLALFRYRRQPDLSVLVEVGGCGDVSNGRLHRTSIYKPGPKLVNQLLTLTHCRRSGPGCA